MFDSLHRHRWTVDEFYRMAEVGVLRPNDCVELIEGELIDLAPSSPRHSSVSNRLTQLMGLAVDGHAIVAVHDPLRLSQGSELRPDLMLLSPRTDFYTGAHPAADDVLLLIEVSDTTARYDRGIKLNLYARHGVQEVWIVDLDEALMRTYRNPRGETYTEVQETAQPTWLTPQALPGVRIDASKLLL